MEKILVTGAAGFVGRAVCAELVSRGVNVVAAMRHESPVEVAATTKEYVGPIHGGTDWTAALSGCDTILHLAARAHILKDSANEPLAEFRKTNVDGTIKLAESAARAGVRRFVFVSSIGVHGRPAGAPFNVSDIPEPVDDYAVSKLEAERALHAIAKETGMELVVVRPPLVYGPGCPGNFLRLIKLIKLGLPLPFAQVSGQRSFVSIWNLVDFLIACMTHPAAANGTFIVSDGQNLTLPELLRALANGMSKPLRLLSINEKFLATMAAAAGVRQLYDKLCGELTVDIEWSRETLQWEPPVSLAAGLRRTAESFT